MRIRKLLCISFSTLAILISQAIDDLQEGRPKPRFVAADGVLPRQLALAGCGIALLPRWLCADDLDRGNLVDLFPHHTVSGTEFGARALLLYASRKYLPLKVRAFVDFIRERIRNGAPEALGEGEN